MRSELQRIDRYRLKNDLTWVELAEEMRRAGFPVSFSTLHHHVKGAPEQEMHERTLLRIRKFLRRVTPRRRSRVLSAAPRSKAAETTTTAR